MATRAFIPDIEPMKIQKELGGMKATEGLKLASVNLAKALTLSGALIERAIVSFNGTFAVRVRYMAEVEAVAGALDALCPEFTVNKKPRFDHNRFSWVVAGKWN